LNRLIDQRPIQLKQLDLEIDLKKRIRIQSPKRTIMKMMKMKILMMIKKRLIIRKILPQQLIKKKIKSNLHKEQGKKIKNHHDLNKNLSKMKILRTKKKAAIKSQSVQLNKTLKNKKNNHHPASHQSQKTRLTNN